MLNNLTFNGYDIDVASKKKIVLFYTIGYEFNMIFFRLTKSESKIYDR